VRREKRAEKKRSGQRREKEDREESRGTWGRIEEQRRKEKREGEKDSDGRRRTDIWKKDGNTYGQKS